MRAMCSHGECYQGVSVSQSIGSGTYLIVCDLKLAVADPDWVRHYTDVIEEQEEGGGSDFEIET